MFTGVNKTNIGYRVYGKLFEQMYDGTLATKGPWQALVTFQQMIILADRHGHVDMTPEAMSRRTTIPLEIIKEGISALEEPDPDSRSPALEGRRIVRLSDDRAWGWAIVNYAHYRGIRSQEERREYMRLYQRARRESVNQNVNKSTSGKRNQPIAVSSMQEAVKQTSRFLDFWAIYPKGTPKQPALKKWQAKRLDLQAEQILEDVRWRLENDRRWKDGIIPHAATYLNQERWKDERVAPQHKQHDLVIP